MPRIVAVHGIAQQFKGEDTLRAAWLPALRDGMRRADAAALPGEDDFSCVFYAAPFRSSGKVIDDFAWEADDLTGEWETELLRTWWVEAARTDRAVPPPGDRGKARTPAFVQSALDALSRSAFFAGLAERLLIGNLKQVSAYLHDDTMRAAMQASVAQSISAETRVLIGHSLGSVVAYEALCAHPDWTVRTLVTLGSPLGIRNLVFERLRPAPMGGKGAWPAGLQRWTNIADAGDIVALAKELAPMFQGAVQDRKVYNGATAHAVERYLTAKETGEAIAAGF